MTINKINRKKLLNSKWTSTKPKNKEKHFIVSKVFINDDDPQVIDGIILTAVLTNVSYELNYSSLVDSSLWVQGWAN